MLDGLVRAVRAGNSRALVICGEAGVGKTALLDYVAEHASGCRVARAAGVQSEMELAFAGVHQLCAPVLDRLERLPAPQRTAPRVAFGLGRGVPPDRFLVGLAVLNLLSDAAEQHPLICLVDDEQWLDQASAQVLGFVARRLVVEPVGLVFAARVPSEDLAGLPQLAVGGLPERDARALLAAVLTGPLDGQVRDRIVAETGGNPLALLELPGGLTPAELAGGFALPDAVPLSASIEASFRRRLDLLPTDTRVLLLVAAADPVGDPVLVWRAAERLGIPARAATAAAEAGLLDVGVRVRFRHPLVRSAAYRSASLSQRQDVHRALAEATDPELAPDRRAWHRAHAAPGPDENVAAELERLAGRAQARGGLSAGRTTKGGTRSGRPVARTLPGEDMDQDATRWTSLLSNANRLFRPTMHPAAAQLPVEGSLPSLDGATEWLNSPPLTAGDLHGHVVLVQFWTYTCVNWLRTLPYVRAWSEKYAGHGLVVLGVHTPEFDFEHDLDNVRRAVKDLRVGYPVAVDSDYAVWTAFANHYWPALYFVDALGHIRHHRFGEGDYDQSEMVLMQLLAAAGAGDLSRDLVAVEAAGLEVAADWDSLRSPENYLGYERADNFASPDGAVLDRRHVYTPAARLRLNHWSLAGAWTVTRQAAVLHEPDGTVAYRFHARDLNLVMAPAARGTPGRCRVRLDGQPPGAAHGTDVDEEGNATVTDPQLYQLIRQPGPVTERTFEITFLDPGVEVYAFTFG